MLKITAIGNLTHDVELKMNENTGKPYAILRIASDRRYKDMSGWQSGSQRTMSSNKKRINLSFSMSSPIQRRAWKKLTEIPAGQRTAAVCRMVCEYKGQQELLDAVRQTIRQELRGMQLTKEEAQDSGRAGGVDESVLGFLLALQEGDEMT